MGHLLCRRRRQQVDSAIEFNEHKNSDNQAISIESVIKTSLFNGKDTFNNIGFPVSPADLCF